MENENLYLSILLRRIHSVILENVLLQHSFPISGNIVVGLKDLKNCY